MDNYAIENKTSLDQILNQVLPTVQEYLQNLVVAKDFLPKMQLAFGNSFKAGVALDLAEDWAKGDFSNLPEVEIHSRDEIDGANGAFAAATNTIYLSREFLSQNANNLEAVTSVLLEEIGHAVDARLNESDSLGDEGAIFSAFLRGETLTPEELAILRAEDDTTTVTLGGQFIQIEQDNTAPRVTSFDAANDFSALDNPNGTWQYGWSEKLNYAFQIAEGVNSVAIPGLNVWQGILGNDLNPSIQYNGTVEPITYINTTWEPGQLAFHPGPNGELAVIRWTSPASSFYKISSAFEGLDTVRGATSNIQMLRNNGTSLFEADIDGSGESSQQLYQDSYFLEVGDTLDFTVGYGSNLNYFSDTTGIEATITAGGDITVDEDAPDTIINLYDIFQDGEDPDSALTYSVVNNTNPSL
jgi:hypothetical protein